MSVSKEIREKLASAGVSLPEILLPNENIDPSRYSVIACDQYTSRPEYWESVKEFVGDEPSTLNLILPEAWLDKKEEYTEDLISNMRVYLHGNVFRNMGEGMMYVERKTTTGIRHGLVLALDLEKYDYSEGSTSLIRATEKTVVERLPARVKVRERAEIEIPHIMVLIDDKDNALMTAAGKAASVTAPAYDFDLMKDSGHIRGTFLSNDESLSGIADALIGLKENTSNGILFAMGDGNHSLAAAKQHWEKIKAGLPENMLESHPARYSMVEIVNLYDEGLSFEPMHRLITGADKDQFEKECGFSCSNPPSLQTVQPIIDRYIEKHPETCQDYIHGADECVKLAEESNGISIVWDRFPKETLFDDVAENGVLCRKSFSMGEADDKRFYLEARKITL